MPKTLTQREYTEIMSKIKSRKLRSELKRYGYASVYSGAVDKDVVIPSPLWEKINAYIREHNQETPPPRTPPKDEVLC